MKQLAYLAFSNFLINFTWNLAVPVLAAQRGQVAAPLPTRIGDVARGLSEQDIADLTRQLPGGTSPWLLVGDPGQSASQIFIEAYLPPETTTSDVRRGSMITLRRSRRTNPATPEVWEILDSNNLQMGKTGNYVQVAIAGRSFDQIQGDSDLNRPFLINGQFTDVELVSLANALRANPGQSNTFAGSLAGLPILNFVRETDDLVTAYLRDGGILRTQRATLRKQAGVWLIVQVVTGRA